MDSFAHKMLLQNLYRYNKKMIIYVVFSSSLHWHISSGFYFRNYQFNQSINQLTFTSSAQNLIHSRAHLCTNYSAYSNVYTRCLKYRVCTIWHTPTSEFKAQQNTRCFLSFKRAYISVYFTKQETLFNNIFTDNREIKKNIRIYTYGFSFHRI